MSCPLWDKHCFITKIGGTVVDKKALKTKKEVVGKSGRKGGEKKPVMIEETVDNEEKGFALIENSVKKNKNSKKKNAAKLKTEEKVDDQTNYKKKAEEAEVALKELKSELDNSLKRAKEAEEAIEELKASLRSYIDMDHAGLNAICIQNGIKAIAGKPTKKHKLVFAILKQMM